MGFFSPFTLGCFLVFSTALWSGPLWWTQQVVGFVLPGLPGVRFFVTPVHPPPFIHDRRRENLREVFLRFWRLCSPAGLEIFLPCVRRFWRRQWNSYAVIGHCLPGYPAGYSLFPDTGVIFPPRPSSPGWLQKPSWSLSWIRFLGGLLEQALSEKKLHCCGSCTF